ncbi:Actin-related protein 2/3 complex subunit 1A [Ooceraea biroi]|uniref:Arp2/3 complex 41 kDa subunit n=1 Tax=Ooceraea biroi TaxID=2015173 RepID=A0A026VXN1_OOCBI|nr:Actin-related protein 2/3 complex subunit 1A [Ooceraea biroi]
MTEVHNFGVDAISCHAWNRDKTEVAICANNNEIQVHQRTSSSWKLLETLEEHHMAVMGIDWAPKTNRIVTCSADKNAYVWTQKEDGKWDPAWVLLRINRAATCVKWSPLENKFAVGSGGRIIAVCYFVSENNWWLCKHIKRPLRSTVTTVDWHPDNKVLVAGSTDYKVRVFSAFISDMEDAPGTSSWGQSNALGTLLAEFPNTPHGGGWIHSVVFSPCGNKICWVSHNSSICVADATKGNAVVRLYTEHLPFLSCIWIGSSNIVAAVTSAAQLSTDPSQAGLRHTNRTLLPALAGAQLYADVVLRRRQRADLLRVEAGQHAEEGDRRLVRHAEVPVARSASEERDERQRPRQRAPEHDQLHPPGVRSRVQHEQLRRATRNLGLEAFREFHRWSQDNVSAR